MDLFSQKRELGYLQIFGLSKGRVLRLVLAEYVIKLVASMMLALILFGGLFAMYCIAVGRILHIDTIGLPCILFFLIMVYLLSTMVATAYFLKKNVLSLIS